MRRAVLTLGGTVAGLVALFSYKTHVPGAPVTEPSTPPALTTSAPLAAGASASASTAPAKKPAPKTSTTQTAPASAKPTTTPTRTTPAKPSGNFEGPDVNTQYGPVQVVLTVSDGKITAANDVQQPADSIGANAIPQLNSEAVQAQSANIQAVSGATSTSQGYIKSLQQAIDKAGL
ncbi:MAG: FMN-binding protein [Trebonia sp.]